jgi:hypothetical protein
LKKPIDVPPSGKKLKHDDQQFKFDINLESVVELQRFFGGQLSYHEADNRQFVPQEVDFEAYRAAGNQSNKGTLIISIKSLHSGNFPGPLPF